MAQQRKNTKEQKVKSLKQLTDQEKRFCYEYLIDFNMTAAYIRAGYTNNYFSAGAGASVKMKDERIKDFIEYLKAEREHRTQVDADKVINELAKLAFFDPRTLYTVSYSEDGTVTTRLKTPTELSPEDSSAIAEISERQVVRDNDNGVTVLDRKYKFHSKTVALAELGKHTGIYEKDNGQKAAASVIIYLPSNGR